MIYLHETVDIRGDGAMPYMEAVLERARHSEAKGVSRLVGTWRVIGSTHRWPRVVNLWEMDDWNHWSRSLEGQFHPRLRDSHLGTWWTAMLRYRSGGLDRILEPTSFCPDRARLLSSGVRGWVTEQQIYRMPPSRLRGFFEEFESSLLPSMNASQLTLIGAYAAPMRSGEALALWSAKDFGTLCRFWEERASYSALQAWQARLEELQVRWVVSWLVPCAGTPLGPEVTEDD